MDSQRHRSYFGMSSSSPPFDAGWRLSQVRILPGGQSLIGGSDRGLPVEPEQAPQQKTVTINARVAMKFFRDILMPALHQLGAVWRNIVSIFGFG